MKMTPTIMITSGGLKMSSKYGKVVTLHPKYYIFLETSSKIKLNEDDHNHYDHYQEPQKKNVSPKCPPNGARRAPYVAEGHKLWPKATSPPQELE